MAKTAFNDAEKNILNELARPGKPKPLSNAKRQCLAQRLAEDLGLEPLLVRIADDYLGFEESDLVRPVRNLRDDHLNYFYLPAMCEAATGSKEGNWREWSCNALGYGRSDHPLAPNVRLHEDIQDELVSNEMLNPNGAHLPVRLLSIEMVVFYIAAQTRTWANPSSIRSLKERIGAIMDMDHFSVDVDPTTLLDDEDEFDPDTLLTPENPVDADEMFVNSTAAKTRLPKKGREMQRYNPASPKSNEDSPVAVVSGDRSGEIVVTKNMSLDEIHAAMASLAALARQKEEEAAMLAAKDFQVTDMEVDIANARPNQLTIRMGDGRSFSYNIQEQHSSGDDLLSNLEY